MSGRAHERFRATVPLFVSYGQRVYQKRVELETKNVSQGGLAFETSQKIPMEAKTRVLVSGLGDLPPDARIEGKIAYRVKNEATGKYAVGVTFTRFVNVDRDALLRGIERWSESSQLTPL